MTQPATPVDWLDDGTPYSAQFQDRYHSQHEGGVAQSVGTFLHGCGLPARWQEQAQWRVLETGFGLGLNFLCTWNAWRQDARRCQRLHFISTEAWPVSANDLVQAARRAYPSLLPLAEELAQQYRDTRPGIHRLVFDQGRVQLTLAIGDAQMLLRTQGWVADSIYLDGFNPAANPDIWSLPTLKAVARCSTPGHTTLATWCVARAVRDTLAQCGFQVERVPGTPPKKHNLRALYAPAWQPHPRPSILPAQYAPGTSVGPRECVVIGAGLAGACMAYHMAERGWQVTVLEQAQAGCGGASALPVGLFAPHVSPDDAPLSRLSRAGIQATIASARALLREGLDWQASGVLEHRIGKKAGLPRTPDAQVPHSHPASASQRGAAGIPDDSPHPVLWHPDAGWLRPTAWIDALLRHPRIQRHDSHAVHRIDRLPDGPALAWQALAEDGSVMATAACMVVAAGVHSAALIQPWLQRPLSLNAVRGQVAWGTVAAPSTAPTGLPPCPVNGKGSFVHVPQADSPEQHLWVSGGTFERENTRQPPDEAARQAALVENRARLQWLMPTEASARDALLFAPPATVHTWWASRCTVPDRTPVFGPIRTAPAEQGLLLATGLGSRGLTLAWLAADTLASALHGEPLPLDASLAQALLSTRWNDSSPVS
ncbi:tRNA 5-methylaminomethyl-2-thiouridine biosynthesis bifunctional protein [Lampropedia hyalina DSM 16112]|jgi:tRNA 5-methylaminomethyl-2-thiouridine biosynthesis bifunctional protein|uniref:tRNA 5-methylaminomethyl-2-thiouridine biosynthesis bifunctional protein MnmC n=1 Tax=Lampropedia hyalina DSM 16112 TaxID=1122156 RepID=A0A1M5E5M4_9BURK|nr:FAD-dependent 5-carboxymethylaminomethyl-2-thiouridine(34) oxidoreductase MnmC [Lampropedia hyalina]SHF74382.1 tRNA 5-methylaminomethyl-2-thiouridine biosynthesis bifunctional protein [Lampropedia hyalina DSM 16112]